MASRCRSKSSWHLPEEGVHRELIKGQVPKNETSCHCEERGLGDGSESLSQSNRSKDLLLPGRLVGKTTTHPEVKSSVAKQVLDSRARKIRWWASMSRVVSAELVAATTPIKRSIDGPPAWPWRFTHPTTPMKKSSRWSLPISRLAASSGSWTRLAQASRPEPFYLAVTVCQARRAGQSRQLHCRIRDPERVPVGFALPASRSVRSL